jgi:hypothetical protein
MFYLKVSSDRESQRGLVKFYTRLVYEPTWEEIPVNILAKKTGGVISSVYRQQTSFPEDTICTCSLKIRIHIEEPM